MKHVSPFGGFVVAAAPGELCNYCRGNIALGHCGGPEDHRCPCCGVVGCALILAACTKCGTIEKPCDACSDLTRSLWYQRGDCCHECCDKRNEDLKCVACGHEEREAVECPSHNKYCWGCNKNISMYELYGKPLCWGCVIEESFGFLDDLDLANFPDLTDDQRESLAAYIRFCESTGIIC